MRHVLEGDRDRNVKLDRKVLLPERSQKVKNHSPDGFNWGYYGSGPSQLALAVVLECTDKPDGYQEFKNKVISTLPKDQPFEVEFDL